MTLRWRLILNGKSACDAALREAVASMRGRGVALDVRVTWERGDAERFVAEAIAAGVDTVIAAGGDGTLNAVASALASHEAAADTLPSLALVPMGTANDFACAAWIPQDPGEAFALIHASVAQPIDLLRIDSGAGNAVDRHWCVNLASAGFGTQVTAETDEGLKKILGGLAYLITGIARLGRIEPIQARIDGARADGQPFVWQGGFIALGAGNGRQAGGGQALCPEAVIDDGLLDLTIVPELEGEIAATFATLLADGQQGALERVAIRERLSWVRIDAPQPFALSLDGEPLDVGEVRIACVAGRLRMHLPPGCPLLRLPGNPLPRPAGDDDDAQEPSPSPVLLPA